MYTSWQKPETTGLQCFTKSLQIGLVNRKYICWTPQPRAGCETDRTVGTGQKQLTCTLPGIALIQIQQGGLLHREPFQYFTTEPPTGCQLLDFNKFIFRIY